MAYVPVTINGVAYPKNKKDPPMPVTIVGYAWITGLQVGGGPATGIPGKPTHPIWDPAHPSHPIELPPPEQPPPVDPPNPPDQAKPPPADGGWGWSPELGWIYFPGSSAPGPKR